MAATGFRLRVKKFEEKVAEKTASAYQRECGKLLDNLVDATPVDTGRLKANWEVGIGKENREYDENRFSKTGAAPKRRGRHILTAITKLSTPRKVVMSNRTPYGHYVNAGIGQPPQRFVEKGVERTRAEGIEV